MTRQYGSVLAFLAASFEARDLQQAERTQAERTDHHWKLALKTDQEKPPRKNRAVKNRL